MNYSSSFPDLALEFLVQITEGKLEGKTSPLKILATRLNVGFAFVASQDRRCTLFV